MEIVRSAQQPAFTPPKVVEPPTASLPGGAWPETLMLSGPVGSSLLTVIVAVLEPKLTGSKRMGIGRELPGPIVIGYDNASGTMNSPADEVIPVTVSVHLPLLVKTSGLSSKQPTQTLPKFPVLAIIRFNLGAGASPETLTTCGEAGSLLVIVIVPGCSPTLVGAKRIGISIASPTPSLIGYESTLGDWKSGGAATIPVIKSSPLPPLSIVSSSSTKEPRQTRPKLPASAMAVTTRPTPGATLKTNGSIEIGTGLLLRSSSVFVAKLAFRW